MRPANISNLQMRIALEQDERALEELYLMFYPSLVRFASSLVLQVPVAEEIVEDVFIRLWQNRETLPQINNLKVYLFVAVKNRSLNYIQWKSKDIIAYLETYPVDISVSQETPESLLMTKEMAVKINKAVEALPSKCKLIFQLVREEHLKYKEVAEVLNISPRTVDTQMTIATKKIAASITLQTITAP